MHMQIDQTPHFVGVIEETLYRRVRETIDQYIKKNQDAFQANKIAGVEWSLGLTVLVDNLGLNPPSNPSFFKRLIDFLTHLWRKVASAPVQADQKAH
jgi:hypothetical protein